MNTLYIALIVLAVLVGGAGFYFVSKKLGLSLINVALSIVTAIRSALENTTLASSKFAMVLNLIIQALTYGNIVAAEDSTDEERIAFAMEYVIDISTKLGIEISKTEESIIRNVLSVGFIFMRALKVKPMSKTYLRMAKITGISKAVRLQIISEIGAKAELRAAHE